MYEDHAKYTDLPKLPNELVQSLEKLKNKRRITYRYIYYYKYPIRTHEKIYNWVKFDNKFFVSLYKFVFRSSRIMFCFSP